MKTTSPFANLLRQSPFKPVQQHMRVVSRCVEKIPALFNAMIQKDRMLKVARAGYSCATEVATHLIREKGYGGRLAHSIVATMIRQARVEGQRSTASR